MQKVIKLRIAMLQEMETILEQIDERRRAYCNIDDDGNIIAPKENDLFNYEYLACIEIKNMLIDMVTKI